MFSGLEDVSCPIGRNKTFFFSAPFSNSKVCNKCGVRGGPVEAARYLDRTEVDADWCLSEFTREGMPKS